MQLIQDLGGHGEKLLKENLAPQEKIKIKLKGVYGEGFVVTDKRLYILKWGFMAGSTFGGRVNAFGFDRISGIEIKKGVLSGTVEVLTPANKDAKYGGWFDTKDSKSDNAVKIERKSFADFLEAVKLTREMISGQQTPDHTTYDNFENHLQKLAELKKKGLITDDEFRAKKAKILGL